MLTCVAVLLVGVWLVVTSQQHVSSTLTLIFGIIVGVLALADLIRPYVWRGQSAPPP
jgi:multisubunit Na+/H+ antiporter MnhE subunit